MTTSEHNTKPELDANNEKDKEEVQLLSTSLACASLFYLLQVRLHW